MAEEIYPVTRRILMRIYFNLGISSWAFLFFSRNQLNIFAWLFSSFLVNILPIGKATSFYPTHVHVDGEEDDGDGV
jgi:hypothetical protein